MPNPRRQSQLESADDDWRQKEGLDERRRAQNRLSQRKRRSQMKASNDTGNGQKQFMFVEPNTITYSRSKTSIRRPTTPPTTKPSREESSSMLGGCIVSAITSVEPPAWDLDHSAGFDAKVMDFETMLWDVDIYDSTNHIRQLSPFNVVESNGNSGVLDGSSGSDMETANDMSVTSGTLPTDRNYFNGQPNTADRYSDKAHNNALANLCPAHPLSAASTADTTPCNPPGSFVGYTALHLAARQGLLAIIKLLVEKGQPIDQLSDSHQTALSLALEGDHIEVMRYLLEQGAFPDALNFDGSTILHMAVKRGQCRAVELLLRYMKDPNVLDRDGCSALHVAVTEGKIDVVRLILERGADTQLKIAPVRT